MRKHDVDSINLAIEKVEPCYGGFRYVKPNLDISMCNAYSGTAYLYAAISTKGRPIIATNVDSAIDWEVAEDMKGGIIVFPEEVDAVKLSENKLINRIKAKFSIGNFLKGRYTGKNGKVYSKDSLSIEIVGVTDDTLIEIAEELCRTFKQENFLVKIYSEKNRILYAQVEA